MTYFFWSAVTRLGEGLILLPAALLLILWLAQRAQAHRLAMSWVVLLGVAVAVTTASKIAFMGWGVGSARFNFTGVSGHSMFAAAIYPLVMRAAASEAPSMRRGAVWFGYLIALLIAISRVKVGAHSWSEVVAGFAVGSAASGLALWFFDRQHASPSARRAPRWLTASVLAWLAFMPVAAPASPTHGWVTKLALVMSGRDAPYTRHDLLRGLTVQACPASSYSTPG